MKTILFLSDSVNRRFLSLYNECGLKLPNLEHLAARSVVFDNHFTASAPCMPARRDIMTGRVNFHERNWSPIEPIDFSAPSCVLASNPAIYDSFYAIAKKVIDSAE